MFVGNPGGHGGITICDGVGVDVAALGFALFTGWVWQL
jgi:hypothetical protein